MHMIQVDCHLKLDCLHFSKGTGWSSNHSLSMSFGVFVCVTALRSLPACAEFGSGRMCYHYSQEA